MSDRLDHRRAVALEMMAHRLLGRDQLRRHRAKQELASIVGNIVRRYLEAGSHIDQDLINLSSVPNHRRDDLDHHLAAEQGQILPIDLNVLQLHPGILLFVDEHKTVWALGTGVEP